MLSKARFVKRAIKIREMLREKYAKRGIVPFDEWFTEFCFQNYLDFTDGDFSKDELSKFSDDDKMLYNLYATGVRVYKIKDPANDDWFVKALAA